MAVTATTTKTVDTDSASADMIRIFLEQKGKLIVAPGNSQSSLELVATFSKNLETLGYVVSPKLFARLRSLSPIALGELYNKLTPILKKAVGAHRRFNPMYPNFPTQVLEASGMELYINAIMHYWGSYLQDMTGAEISLLPKYVKEKREKLDLKTEADGNLKIIDLGSLVEFKKIFTELAGSNSSLSPTNKEALKWFCENYKDKAEKLLPAVIPQKETIAMLMSWLGCPDYLLAQIKTATDVLRLATVMSEGDVSLAKPTKFKNLSRSVRRFLMTALDACGNVTEDMLRYPGNWTRLGEKLHPGEFKKTFPTVFSAFNVLRNNKPFETFASKTEAAFKGGKSKEITKVLATRPGEFARRLDHALRIDASPSVVHKFLSVAENVSTPVLLTVYNHFKIRNTLERRAIFPKGVVSNIYVQEMTQVPLPAKISSLVSNGIRNILVERFGKLSKLGTCYIDPKLKDCLVPFANRSASKALHTITRGSKIEFGSDANCIRFFLWWKEPKGVRTDVDLAACLMREDFSVYTDISFYNLRDGLHCHSGDIVQAPNGACEFIDIDIKGALNQGCRYLSTNIYSYTQQPFVDMPECYAGWMMRSAPKSGEIFEPATVHNKIDLASDTGVAIPVLLDLQERKVIWCDISFNNQNKINAGRSKRISQLMRAMSDLKKPNLYDLFEMHVEARGELMDEPTDCDNLFTFDEGTTPYDITKIMNEFVA